MTTIPKTQRIISGASRWKLANCSGGNGITAERASVKLSRETRSCAAWAPRRFVFPPVHLVQQIVRGNFHAPRKQRGSHPHKNDRNRHGYENQPLAPRSVRQRAIFLYSYFSESDALVGPQ